MAMSPPAGFNVRSPKTTTPTSVSRAGSPTSFRSLSSEQKPTTPVSRGRLCSDALSPGFIQRFANHTNLRSPTTTTPAKVSRAGSLTLSSVSSEQQLTTCVSRGRPDSSLDTISPIIYQRQRFPSRFTVRCYNNIPPMIYYPCMQEQQNSRGTYRCKKENTYNICFQPFSYAVHGQYNYYSKSCQHHQSLTGIKYVYSLLGFKFHIYSISLPNHDGQGFRLDFCTKKQGYAKGSFELTEIYPEGKITASVYHYGMEKTLNMNIYLGPQMKSCEPFEDEEGKKRMCILVYT